MDDKVFLGLPGPGRPHARQLRVMGREEVVGHSEMFASSSRHSCGNNPRRDLEGRLAQGQFRPYRRATIMKRISVGAPPSPDHSQKCL